MTPQIVFAWLILTLDPSDGSMLDRAFRFPSMEMCLQSVAVMRIEQAKSHDNEGFAVAVCVAGDANAPKCLTQYGGNAVSTFPYCVNPHRE